jgi:outer membrane immunogenic protein
MRVFAVGFLLAAVCGPAFAADIVPLPGPLFNQWPFNNAEPSAHPPRYSWTGFYVGANGGYGFVSGMSTASIAGGLLNGVTATTSGSFGGAVAGGQFGANYQINSFVLGVEGDVDWSGQSHSNTLAILSKTSGVPYIGTLRARAGYAIDRLSLYGTAGMAVTNASDVITAAGATIYSATSNNIGWTAGAGAEYAFAQNWTVKAEYLYIATNIDLTGPLEIVGGTITQTAKLNDSLIRAGLNFKILSLNADGPLLHK